MLTSNVQLGYVLTRGWGQAVQGGLSSPLPRISERIDNTQILLHHLLQEYLDERDVNFISVNLRCLLQTFSLVTSWQGVGGKLSRAVYLAPPPPPPRISERMDNQQILLHHPLQEYLVDRDINSISVNLRCLLQMFSWVTYWQGVGGKLSRAVYLATPPPPIISERMDTPSTAEIFSWKGHKLHWDAYFKHSVGLHIDKGWGASCPGRFILAPPRISERMDNLQILLHHLLQEHLVERDINFTEMLTSNIQLGYLLTRGGGQAVQGGLSWPRPEFQREWIIHKFYYTIYYRNI